MRLLPPSKPLPMNRRGEYEVVPWYAHGTRWAGFFGWPIRRWKRAVFMYALARVHGNSRVGAVWGVLRGRFPVKGLPPNAP